MADRPCPLSSVSGRIVPETLAPDPVTRSSVLFRHVAHAWTLGAVPQRLAPASATAADLARFFEAVAAAEPNVILAPYLGVWDASGRPVYTYDLFTLDAFPGTRTVAPSLGVSVYTDAYADGALAEDFVPRRHGDVVQIVVGRELARERDLQGRAPEEADQWVYEGLHDYAGHTVPWHRVRVLGSAFERADLLAAAGLPLAALLDALRLRSPEADHAARAAAFPDLDRLHALLAP